MFLLSKILTNILLPPGIILFFFLPMFYCAFTNRKKTFLMLLCFCFLSLYLLSVEPVKDTLLSPLQNKYEPFTSTNAAKYNAVVVLGGGSIESSPEENGGPSLDPSSLKRLFYGWHLAKQLHLPLVLSGGTTLNKLATPEAMVMQNTLLRLGVKGTNIFIEPGSRNTHENAKLSKIVLDNNKFSSVILVTSAYHMPRSMYSFTKFGIKATPAPTDYKAVTTRYSLLNLIPSMSCLTNSYIALHEYLGLLYYKLLSS